MPDSIRRFEYMYFAVFALGVLNALLTYNAMSAAMPPELGSMFLPTVLVVTLAVLVGLVLLISRGRKNWAKWVLVAFTVIGLINWGSSISATFQMDTVAGVFSIIQTLLQIGAIYMLFQPDARAYLGRRAEE